MRALATLPLLAVLFAVAASAAEKEQPEHRKLQAVPFTKVKLDDEFWSARLKTNREKSLPHNFKWCEETGRVNNFAKAAGLVDGKFEGIYFNDSDVYKVLEGASYSLADHPDPALEKTVDEVIAKIAAAQQEDGYLNSYYTLVEPDKKWTHCAKKHELYCAGHLIEAAVAHHRTTGSRTLLDVAVRFADRIDQVFGPNGRCDVPGHEEIELALVKLFELTGEKRYMDLARFFIDARGDTDRREVYGQYCQDHVPVRDQSEIVGHAVRAMYLYSGVADVAGYSGDQGYVDAMDRLWQSVVGRKMYVTGGIGVQHHGEGFSADYNLPNAGAYCETCAAIGMALWNHRLNLMHADGKYFDVAERAIYNGVLSGIALDGQHFFYVNPLASAGGHHRQEFFGCACCPTNVVRFVPSVPGYAYAQGSHGVYVNLYAAGVAQVARPTGIEYTFTQETRYPWDGKVRLTLDVPEKTGWFQILLRIPDWCEGATVSLNGEPYDRLGKAKGYWVLCRYWAPGDVIELDLPMPVRRVEANPQVEADRSRVALQRGPLVYCFEAVDNPGGVANIILPHDPEFTTEHRPDLLGGVTVITCKDRTGRELTAVPYYAWDHREPGEMAVWVRQDGKPRAPDVDDPAWDGQLYRTLDTATLGPSVPFTPAELATASASHSSGNDATGALNDLIEPSDSCDHGVPRFTWWDHKGTEEWVGYDFGAARNVSAVEVYWFDDGRVKRHCRAPKSWRLVYRHGDSWRPVTGASGYGVELDRFNRVSFDPIETTALRIEVQLNPPWSGGILEWKVE